MIEIREQLFLKRNFQQQYQTGYIFQMDLRDICFDLFLCGVFITILVTPRQCGYKISS